MINNYFDWLYNMVCPNSEYYLEDSYDNILLKLFNTPFIYILSMDENRYADGIDLRYRYEYETGKNSGMGDHKCNVLEMMIALAIRSEDIMDNPHIGDRTYYWFWQMMKSLGLSSMTNDNYDEFLVDDIIKKFLYRNYNPDGKGGLFTIPGCGQDLRDVEIWHQMCWYIDRFV